MKRNFTLLKGFVFITFFLLIFNQANAQQLQVTQNCDTQSWEIVTTSQVTGLFSNGTTLTKNDDGVYIVAYEASSVSVDYEIDIGVGEFYLINQVLEWDSSLCDDTSIPDPKRDEICEYAVTPTSHIFWIQNIFSDSPAYFKPTSTNSVHLKKINNKLFMSGSVKVAKNRGSGVKDGSNWSINVWFEYIGKRGDEYNGKPVVNKIERGIDDDGSWDYWMMTSASLTETTGNGLIELHNLMNGEGNTPLFGFQVGDGGSLKNMGFGASAWFGYKYYENGDLVSESQDPTQVSRPIHGDININLELLECKDDDCVAGPELIENGDFNNEIPSLSEYDGNNGSQIVSDDITGFSSFSPYYNQTNAIGQYGWGGRAMNPEGTFAVANNPKDYHPAFFDYNSESCNYSYGNMLIINGANNEGRIVNGRGKITSNNQFVNYGGEEGLAVPLWASNAIFLEAGKSYKFEMSASSVVVRNAAELNFRLMKNSNSLGDLVRSASPVFDTWTLNAPEQCNFGLNKYNSGFVAQETGWFRLGIFNNEEALSGNDFAIDNISLRSCEGNEELPSCGVYFQMPNGLVKAIKTEDGYVADEEKGIYVEYSDFEIIDLGNGMIEIPCSPCDVYYIDNSKDIIYQVRTNEFAGKAYISEKFNLRDTKIGTSNSRIGDAHIALNVTNGRVSIESGSRMYVFQSGNPRHFGYFDMDGVWNYLGKLQNYVPGSIVQATFDQHGRLFVTSTGRDKLYEIANIYDINSSSDTPIVTEYGEIKIANQFGTDYNSAPKINIQGADIVVDQDGSFFLATHKNRSLYSISGFENYMLGSKVNTTDAKLTGIAAHGNDLIYSARGNKFLTLIDKNGGNRRNLEMVPALTSAWGDMTSACVEYVEACVDFASNDAETINYKPGTLMKGSGAPITVRTQSVNATGLPEFTDGRIDFASLGSNGLGKGVAEVTPNIISQGYTIDNGFIELKLNSKLYNWNKNGLYVGSAASRELMNGGNGLSYADLIIVETTWGRMNTNCGEDMNRNYPERALFYGSVDGINWAYIGNGCRTTFLDIAPALEQLGSDYIEYIRIVDFTDANKHSGSADGYDVNGLIYCQENVFQAITGITIEGGMPQLANARQSAETQPVFDWDAFVTTPDVVDSFGDEIIDLANNISIYPNPSTDFVNIDVRLQTEGSEIDVKVYDVTGRLVYDRQAETVLTDRVNFSEFGAGLYLARVSAGGETQTVKFIITK